MVVRRCDCDARGGLWFVAFSFQFSVSVFQWAGVGGWRGRQDTFSLLNDYVLHER